MPRLPVEIICLLPYQCIKTKPQLTGLVLDRGRTVLKMKIWIQLKKGPHLTLQMGPSSLHVQKEHMSWKMVPLHVWKQAALKSSFCIVNGQKNLFRLSFLMFDHYVNICSDHPSVHGRNPHLYATLSFYWHEINNVWPYCVSLTRCHRTEAWGVNTYGWKKIPFSGSKSTPIILSFYPSHGLREATIPDVWSCLPWI